MSLYHMTTSEYLQTPQGQYSRYLWRNLRGYSYYLFDREPPGKATGNSQKADFQGEILHEMKKNNRGSYRSRIVAEIRLDPTSKNPPHIHTAMKNLLDIFEKPLPQSGIGRKALIYQNDNQIAYLSVRYHLGSDEKGIRAKFAPFRCFAENLNLAHDILSGRYDDSLNRYDFEREIEEINSAHRDYDFSEAMRELRKLEEGKRDFIRLFSEKVYNSRHLMDIMRAQESLLAMSKLSVDDLYNIYNTSKVFQENFHLRELAKIVSEWVTASPIRMQLPSLPTKEDEKKPFKEEIRKCLIEFKSHYDILEPLYIPVVLEVIYKPPVASEGFYKDLDNIIREFILPIFHEEFKPPPTHASIFDTIEINDDKALKEMIERIPKSVPYSVAGYELVEMPRHPEDKEDGLLVVGISPGSFVSHSLWYRIDEVIERWSKCCNDL